MNIKSWLRRLPQPAKLRLDKKDLLNVGEGKNKWRDVVDAIITKQPHLVEALDSEGNLIRVTELANEGETTDDGAPKTEKQSELAQLGKLLLEAYKAGAEQHKDFVSLAFEENTKLVTVLAQRLAGLEQAWQATLEARAADLAAAGDETGLMQGPLAPMMQGLAMKMMTQTATAAAGGSNGKSNGQAAGKGKRK